jgi:hypothetical protein
MIDRTTSDTMIVARGHRDKNRSTRAADAPTVPRIRIPVAAQRTFTKAS